VEFPGITSDDAIQNDMISLTNITSGNHDFVTTLSQFPSQKSYLQLGSSGRTCLVFLQHQMSKTRKEEDLHWTEERNLRRLRPLTIAGSTLVPKMESKAAKGKAASD